ncbi:ThuA domain-containing protein [Candidatus Aerophobetes bacterium]|nr:ThuA domain-containing protein [Candidatus Aerophobetes bacterium]
MRKIKTLVFTGGEIHDFKGCGEAIVEALSKSRKFEITQIENDLSILVSPNLDPYELIVFYYTVGKITDAQKNGLLNFVASGKGYVGIHSAADSFRECPEYRAMVGGYFVTHPHYREYQVSVVDSQHPITKDLTEFMVTDEQYILDFDPRVNILCSALWKGKAMPVAWTKNWGKGRVFYLALGHDKKACQHEIFCLLLVRGALWAAGLH